MNWPTIHYPDPKHGPHEIALVKSPRDRSAPDVELRPWYLRLPAHHPSGKSWHSLGTAEQAEAIRRARQFLLAWEGSTDRHMRAQAELAGPARTTYADLAAAWAAAGYPDGDEHPRPLPAAERMASTIRRALDWWGSQDPLLTSRDTLREFARARRAVARRRRHQRGDRVIDLELAALSCLCQWAVATRRLERNPLADRPRYRRPEDVRHCNKYRPATDEELHAILRWMWQPAEPTKRVVAGAVLAWCALTGQRPGEVGYLRADAQAAGDRRQPGARWTVRDGSARIACHRAKNGINPAVRIHPALEAYLDAWLRFRREHWPRSPWYFPDPDAPQHPLPQDRLNAHLDAATAALGLPERHPHAMRAYYVRARRSDGIDDGTIAVELGQSSGPALVTNTYGRADDILGDGAFDWLPESAEPAWSLLKTATEPIASS